MARQADGSKLVEILVAAVGSLDVPVQSVRQCLVGTPGNLLLELLQERIELRFRNCNFPGITVILSYNNAIITLYQKLNNQVLERKQSAEIGSELVKENIGLPSIVAFYLRLRNDSRVAILCTIKQSVRAPRFWGLLDDAKFSLPGLLSTGDELQAHLWVLLRGHEAPLSRFSSFSQLLWPKVQRSMSRGVLYKLNEPGFDVLIRPQINPWAQSCNVYTVIVEGLCNPVTGNTAIPGNSFAGRVNVGITQVHFWIPGIVLESPRLSVDIEHGGYEAITDPDDKVPTFRHAPVQLASEYDWRAIKNVTDISQDFILSRQVLASDWQSNNANTKVQGPLGPFTIWKITTTERMNGKLDFKDVKEAYLEFHGSNFPFGH